MDLTPTLAAESNQITADDLIGGPLTLRIIAISGTGNKQQPVSIQYDGSDGKAFLPCKSMRRVLAGCWGADGHSYVGRSVTVFRDPEVTHKGVKVGGVRISHLSHIDGPMEIMLTEKRGKKAPYRIEPLVTQDPLDAARQQLLSASEGGLSELEQAWKALPNATRKELAGDWWEDLKASTANATIPVQTTATMADYLEPADE